MLEKHIPMFDEGEEVITESGQVGKIVGMNFDIRFRKGRRWTNEKYLVKFKDGSQDWIKYDEIELFIEADHDPIQAIDSINGLLQDCLLLSTAVPLDVRIKTIKEMQKGIEGEDKVYGL
jgi:hypothetical protein